MRQDHMKRFIESDYWVVEASLLRKLANLLNDNPKVLTHEQRAEAEEIMSLISTQSMPVDDLR